MLAKGKPHKWRKPTIAITVVVLLGSLLWACHTPAVAESDVPAFAIAPYPGATITYRHWTNEDHGRTLDNRKYAQAAQLALHYRLASPTEWRILETSYRDRLRANGYEDCPTVDYGLSVIVIGCRVRDSRLEQVIIGSGSTNPADAGSRPAGIVTEYVLQYSFGRAG
jgi:hypothetical protein